MVSSSLKMRSPRIGLIPMALSFPAPLSAWSKVNSHCTETNPSDPPCLTDHAYTFLTFSAENSTKYVEDKYSIDTLVSFHDKIPFVASSPTRIISAMWGSESTILPVVSFNSILKYFVLFGLFPGNIEIGRNTEEIPGPNPRLLFAAWKSIPYWAVWGNIKYVTVAGSFREPTTRELFLEWTPL